MDDLKRFVLEGPAREVDAWWAINGQGWRVVCNCTDEWPHICSECNAGVAPEFTTDRTLSHVIEDAVRAQKPIVVLAYFAMICEVVSVTKNDGDWTAEPLWHGAILHADATNRQRILAAARAMGLKHD